MTSNHALARILPSIVLVILSANCQHQTTTSEYMEEGYRTLVLLAVLSPAREPNCSPENFLIVTSTPQPIRFAVTNGYSWAYPDVTINSGQSIVFDTTTTDLVAAGFHYPPNYREVNAGSDCGAVNNYPRGTIHYTQCTGATNTASCQIFADRQLTTLSPGGSYLLNIFGPYGDLKIHN